MPEIKKEEEGNGIKVLKITSVLVLVVPMILGAFFIFKNPALKGIEAVATSYISYVKSGALSFVSTLGSILNSEPIVNQKLSNPPIVVKAVYLTGYAAGTKSYVNYVLDLAKSAGINAAVVDVKDFSGYVSYNMEAPKVIEYKANKKKIADIDALVKKLHDAGIYAIARIAVFQDPVFAKAKPELSVNKKSKIAYDDEGRPILSTDTLWRDNLSLAWADPNSKDVWDYNISIAKDALSHGFDEINFDYIRFPSDGSLSDMYFPNWNGKSEKHEVIKSFFNYLSKELKGSAISADLFGLATVNYDDLGIGQTIEDAFGNFDYICPMVYPSHYASGFLRYSNPADYPYEVIKYSMDSAFVRLKGFNMINFSPAEEGSGSATSDDIALPMQNNQELAGGSEAIEIASDKRRTYLRPWIQDFNMGAKYDAKMVKSEINAVSDSLGEDYRGFMLWNPSNNYTAAALK